MHTVTCAEPSGETGLFACNATPANIANAAVAAILIVSLPSAVAPQAQTGEKNRNRTYNFFWRTRSNYRGLSKLRSFCALGQTAIPRRSKP